MQIEWPDREEWAKRRRTPYADLMPEISKSFSEYATDQEITVLFAALRDRWLQYGRALRTAGDANEVQALKDKRSGINRGLKIIGRGRLPLLLDDHYGAQDLLAPFIARWREAQQRAEDAKAQEIEQRPIDDAAWEAELRRRAEIEERYCR